MYSYSIIDYWATSTHKAQVKKSSEKAPALEEFAF